jgi:Flp pilus assembly pilin Flp
MTHLNTFLTTLALRLRKEEGQTMAEYAVVLGVITVLCFITFGLLSDAIIAKLEEVISIL